MTPRKDHFPHPDPPVRSPSLQVVHPHAAAVDIGAAEHWVAVPPDRDAQPVRRFGTCTVDLEAIADWLLACDVTTVAMASTGVSWMPLCAVLEARGFQAILIDPRQAQRAPGWPTSDPRDCQWLQRLHASGFLAGAFRPAAQGCVLRAYLRQRRMRIPYASQPIQQRQNALEQRNLTLPEVVSDITGGTGMAIIKAILAGERDPVRLAQRRDRRCQHSAEQIAKAFQGPWRAPHLFA
jgi:transposase